MPHNGARIRLCEERTCKIGGIDPLIYLTDVIARIVNRHPNSRIDELLPWAYAQSVDLKHVA